MDYEKVKLRSDLDALTRQLAETTAALSARVETLERQAAAEAEARAAAAAAAKAEVAKAVAEANAKAAKRPFGLKAKKT